MRKLKEKAINALITDKFHVENFIEFEKIKILDLKEFKNDNKENEIFYDNNYWNKLYTATDNDNNKILEDLLLLD